MALITQLLPWQLPCTWFDDRHYIRAFVDRFKFKLTMSLFIFLNIPQKLKRLSPGFILRTGGPLMSQSKRQTHWHQKEMAFGKGDLTHPAEWPTNCDHSTKSTARRAFSLWSHPVCPRKQRRVILCCNTGSSWDVKSLEMEKHITYPVECYQGCTSQNRKMTNSMNLAEGFINYPVDNHCRTRGGHSCLSAPWKYSLWICLFSWKRNEQLYQYIVSHDSGFCQVSASWCYIEWSRIMAQYRNQEILAASWKFENRLWLGDQKQKVQKWNLHHCQDLDPECDEMKKKVAIILLLFKKNSFSLIFRHLGKKITRVGQIIENYAVGQVKSIFRSKGLGCVAFGLKVGLWLLMLCDVRTLS